MAIGRTFNESLQKARGRAWSRASPGLGAGPRRARTRDRARPSAPAVLGPALPHPAAFRLRCLGRRDRRQSTKVDRGSLPDAGRSSSWRSASSDAHSATRRDSSGGQAERVLRRPDRPPPRARRPRRCVRAGARAGPAADVPGWWTPAPASSRPRTPYFYSTYDQGENESVPPTDEGGDPRAAGRTGSGRASSSTTRASTACSRRARWLRGAHGQLQPRDRHRPTSTWPTSSTSSRVYWERVRDVISNESRSA